MKENLLRNSSDIQREIPIKSSNPFLYEYWKVFSYLYFKQLSNKFVNLNSQKYSNELLNSISINDLMKREENNTILSKEKEKKKDTISLNSFNSLNNNLSNNQNSCFNNGIKISYPDMNTKEMNNLLFQGQKQNTLFDLGNNYINPVFSNMQPNSQNNNIFQNYQPQKIQYFPNNYNLNQIYPTSNLIQNNLGKSLRPNNYGENNNSIPYYQMPLRNAILQPLSNTIIPNNNIMPTSIPNNFMAQNNNSNINTNQNLNSEKNVNNIKINKINSEKINLENNKDIKNINKKQNTENKNKDLLSSLNNNNSKTNIVDNINLNSKENNINNIIKEEKSNSQIIPEKNDQTPLNKSKNQNTKPKIHKVFFNIKESIPRKEGDLLTKKRKRFIKNNKLVFVQMDENELNLKNEKVYDEDEDLDFQTNTKPRGSRFRGVSKNGSQWQVLIMVRKKKRYLGSFSSEEEAARAYDKVALQNHGNKAKTNYDYTKEEIEKILQGPKLLKLQ